MKKIALSLVALFAFGAVSAQDIKLSHTGTKEFTIGPDGPDDCPLYFTNNTTKPLVVSYKKIYADAPAGWIITLCDNVNCYGELIVGDTFATIQPNEKASIKISFLAMKKADTATIMYEIWNKYGTDQVKDTLSWKVYMPNSASTDITKYVVEMVGPNPVISELSVPVISKQLSVFDVQGKLLMYKESCTSGKLNFDILPAGNYVVAYTVNNVQYKHQIIKQ